MEDDRLIRPRARYIGPTDQEFVPIGDRQLGVRDDADVADPGGRLVPLLALAIVGLVTVLFRPSPPEMVGVPGR